MENPIQHGPATQIIRQVIESHHQAEFEDRLKGQFRSGTSLELQIAQALQHHGYLHDADVWNEIEAEANEGTKPEAP
jgi:hypothetical protein